MLSSTRAHSFKYLCPILKQLLHLSAIFTELKMTKPKVLSGTAKRKKIREEKQNILKTNKKIQFFFNLDKHEQSKFLIKILFFCRYFNYK